MKKFRFNLETVLKVRKRQQEDALQVLAKAQNILIHFETQRDLMRKKLLDSLERRSEFGKKIRETSVVKTEEDFIQGTKVRLEKVAYTIQKAQKNVDKAMSNYLKLKSRTRAVEILKEREFEKHKLAVKKYEQKNLDDIVSMRNHLKDNIFHSSNEESDLEYFSSDVEITNDNIKKDRKNV